MHTCNFLMKVNEVLVFDSQSAKIFIHLLLSTIIDNNERLGGEGSGAITNFINQRYYHEYFNVLLFDSQYAYIRN